MEIRTNGEGDTVKLNRGEQSALRKALDTCRSLEKHTDDENAATANTALKSLVARYCAGASTEQPAG